MRFYNAGFHDYEGVAIIRRADSLVRDSGAQVMLMRNTASDRRTPPANAICSVLFRRARIRCSAGAPAPALGC